MLLVAHRAVQTLLDTPKPSLVTKDNDNHIETAFTPFSALIVSSLIDKQFEETEIHLHCMELILQTELVSATFHFEWFNVCPQYILNKNNTNQEKSVINI